MPEPTIEGPHNPTSRLFPRVAAMMFLQYWPLGVWGVTVGTYIAANTGEQGEAIFSAGFAGYSTITGAVGSLVAPLVFGFLSDRLLPAERLVALLHLGCAAAAWWMSSCRDELNFFIALLVYWNCFNPACALTNKIALQHLPEPDRQYPHARLFATGGWISAGLFIGLVWPSLSGRSIEDTATPIMVGAASNLVMACYALTLPHTRPNLLGGRRRPSLWRDALRLLANRPLVLCLCASAAACLSSMAYNAYANLFLNWAGYSNPAALMTLGQVSDVLCLFALPGLIARFGLRRLFLAGVAAWSVRYGLLTFASATNSHAAVYAAILVHGPCYVFVYVAGLMLVDRLVAPDHRGAAQGLNAAATTGLGHLGGALMAGSAQETFLTPDGVSPPPYHWAEFWGIPALAAIAATTLFVVILPKLASTNPPQHSD